MEHVLNMLLPIPSQQQQQQQPADSTVSAAAPQSASCWAAPSTTEADDHPPTSEADHPAAAARTAPPKSAETEEHPLGQAVLHQSKVVTRHPLPTAVAASASHSSSPAVQTREGAPATGPHPSASSTDSMTAREAGAASPSSGDEPMSGPSARTSNAVEPHAASVSSTSVLSNPNTQPDAAPHPPPAPVSKPEKCRHDSVGQLSSSQAALSSGTLAYAADNSMYGGGATAEQALADSLGSAQPQSLSHTAADDSQSASHSAASHLPSSTQSPSDCSQIPANARYALSPTTASQTDEVQPSAAETLHCPTTTSLDGQADAPARAKQEEEDQQAWGSSAQGNTAEQHESSLSPLGRTTSRQVAMAKQKRSSKGSTSHLSCLNKKMSIF